MGPELNQFASTLRGSGLHAALGLLNSRTSHRFTGVYRFEGEWLRNVALFDRWTPDLRKGDDAPLSETFCGIVPSQGSVLEVMDVRQDARFPWMNDNAVICYCGTLIKDDAGFPFGTLCHFDLRPAQAPTSDFPLLQAAAPLIFAAVAG